MIANNGLAIVISVIMIWYFIHVQNKGLEENGEKLSDIAEGIADLTEILRPEQRARIENMMKIELDNSVHLIIEKVVLVRTQNHISDRDATELKIAGILDTIHDERNGRLDYYRWKGRPASYYTSQQWVTTIHDIFVKAVYEENFNETRLKNSLEEAYRRIRLEFSQHLGK